MTQTEAVWTCPVCDSTTIVAFRWELVQTTYLLSIVGPDLWDIDSQEPSDLEPSYLMWAKCDECSYVLTEGELKRIAMVVGLTYPNQTVTIEIGGGALWDVEGLPAGWNYELIDHDILEEDPDD